MPQNFLNPKNEILRKSETESGGSYLRMSPKKYTPEQGDIVWIDFNPTKGHEQQGKRPGVILSRSEYNKATGLAVVCPITSQVKGYPFEVVVNTGKIQGAILADQVRSVDWKDRRVSFIARCDASLLEEVKEKLALLIR